MFPHSDIRLHEKEKSTSGNIYRFLVCQEADVVMLDVKRNC